MHFKNRDNRVACEIERGDEIKREAKNDSVTSDQSDYVTMGAVC